jgi:sec-independent protein translocase protein TatB
MFDISWSELLIIGVVALIAIGPKELPGVLRAVGQWMGKVRRMASEFQSQFQEAMREAEVADLKKQVDDMTSSVTDYTNFDPMESVRKEVDGLIGDPLAEPAADKPAAASDAGTASTAAPESTAQPAPDATVPRPDAASETEVAEAPPKTASTGGGGA